MKNFWETFINKIQECVWKDIEFWLIILLKAFCVGFIIGVISWLW